MNEPKAISTPLKYSLTIKNKFHRLPFVKRTKQRLQCWVVPATGDYVGGYQIGEAMAHAYIKYLQSINGNCDEVGYLLEILGDIQLRMLECGYANWASICVLEWPYELSSLHGQRTGFVRTVEQWLIYGAKTYEPVLDLLT